MTNDELLAHLALAGFTRVLAYTEAERYMLSTALRQRVYPELLMVTRHASRISPGGYYSCSLEGMQKLNTRNADKVWNWVSEQLY
jgi:hypothetical protein